MKLNKAPNGQCVSQSILLKWYDHWGFASIWKAHFDVGCGCLSWMPLNWKAALPRQLSKMFFFPFLFFSLAKSWISWMPLKLDKFSQIFRFQLKWPQPVFHPGTWIYVSVSVHYFCYVFWQPQVQYSTKPVEFQFIIYMWFPFAYMNIDNIN